MSIGLPTQKSNGTKDKRKRIAWPMDVINEKSATNPETEVSHYSGLDRDSDFYYGSHKSYKFLESLPELGYSRSSAESTFTFDPPSPISIPPASTQLCDHPNQGLEAAKASHLSEYEEYKSRKRRLEREREQTNQALIQLSASKMADYHCKTPDTILGYQLGTTVGAPHASVNTYSRLIHDIPTLKLAPEQGSSGFPNGGIVDSPKGNSISDRFDCLPELSEYLLGEASGERYASNEPWLPYPSLSMSQHSNVEPDFNKSSTQNPFLHNVSSTEKSSDSDRDTTTDASIDPDTGVASDMETDWEEMGRGRDQWYNEICMSNRGKRPTNRETRQSRRERLLKERREQKMIDKLMTKFYNIFRKVTTEFRSCAGGQYPSSQDSLQRGNNKINCSSIRATGNKRSNVGGDYGEEEQEEDRPPKRFKQVHKSHEERLPGLKFACPFHQHNPRKYGIGDMLCDASYRSCAGPGFLSIARMKEHLYRRHRIPIRCNRCGMIFKTQEYLKAHVRVLLPCEVQPEVPLEGVTEEMEKQLKSRKKAAPHKSDEDRWRAVYHILFPSEDIPCPYYDNDNVVAAFQEYSNQETPRVFLRMLEGRASTNQLTQEIRNDLIDIVQECRIYVYRQYHQEAVRKRLTAVEEIEAAIPALTSNDSQSDSSNLEAHLQPQDYIEDPADYDPAEFEAIFQDPFGTESDSGFDDPNWGSQALNQCFCFGPCSCVPFPGSKSSK